MSTDLKLDKICDHQIVREQLYISDDLKTIKLPRAIASSVVGLWVNDYQIEKTHSEFGWYLQEASDFQTSKRFDIVFNNPRKAVDDFYFVTYVVRGQECPKCKARRVLFDISYTTLGNPQMVVNEKKLIQEMKKGITTELGSNPFHVWIGTRLKQLIGSKVSSYDYVRSRMVQEVNNYLQRYIEIQLQQSRYQDITDAETLFQILSVNAEPLFDVDVSYWTVEIVFANRTGQEVTITDDFELPEPKNLLYAGT